MNESLLKTDQIGRLRHTPEQKKTLVDACRASGVSGASLRITSAKHLSLAVVPMVSRRRDSLKEF